MKKIRAAVVGGLAVAATFISAAPAQAGDLPVIREWNELLLESIRNDYARPTVHARNGFHWAVCAYDAWAAFDDVADQWLHQERMDAKDVQAARDEAISYALYRLLTFRFQNSPGADEMLPQYDAYMDALGYDKDYTDLNGDNPAALGNRIANTVLFFGLLDGANEVNDYANIFYEPVNVELLPDFEGNPNMTDPNRWQPLALEWFEDQSGNIIVGGYPEALSPEWGTVTSFSLSDEDLTVYTRDGNDYWLFHDPGPPPYHGGFYDAEYKWGHAMVSVWSAQLDPADGVMWDISPGSIGNATMPTFDQYDQFYNFFEGGDWGEGHDVNPWTGEPYEPNIVPRADYGRILAEFWADGPDSETPPGHWVHLLNYVADHELFEKRWNGEGPIMDETEWYAKAYFTMTATMHDVAIASWGVKGWYDYARPVSAIRWMCDQGQSSDPDGPSYHPDGIPLYDGYVEVITADTTGPGQRHEHLAGNEGKIAILAWRGPDYINDPDTDLAGVGWILAGNWWPYQRPSFVTPPFPGYVSGHSTYSRAAAWTMTYVTGTEYWPGGMGTFHCPQNEYLVFEEGPSVDVTLQWATYFDASDQTSLSRIWGGIHPPADDIPGRLMGDEIGPSDWFAANKFFNGQMSCPSDSNGDRMVNVDDLIAILSAWGTDNPHLDTNEDGVIDVEELIALLGSFGECPDA